MSPQFRSFRKLQQPSSTRRSEIRRSIRPSSFLPAAPELPCSCKKPPAAQTPLPRSQFSAGRRAWQFPRQCPWELQQVSDVLEIACIRESKKTICTSPCREINSLRSIRLWTRLSPQIRPSRITRDRVAPLYLPSEDRDLRTCRVCRRRAPRQHAS